MNDEYSLYDAKAKLSEIVRMIRAGHGPVVVTLHGTPAVEIRRYQPPSTDLDARWAELEAAGVLTPAKRRPSDAPWKSMAKRPGALRRFLDERDDG